MIDLPWLDNDADNSVDDAVFPMRASSLGDILEAVRHGHCVRVLGSRYRGKSELLKTAVAQLNRSGTHTAAYLSLVALPLVSGEHFFASLYRNVPLVNEADFFSGLFDTIQKKLQLRSRLTSQSYPRTAFGFQNELLNLIRLSSRNIVLFIDDLEAIPPNLVASLLGVLQAIYITLIDEPGARFQAVVCGSLSFSQLTLENASHFESISNLVLIPDFGEADVYELVENVCQQENIPFDDAIVPYLVNRTGGDANLIVQILKICNAQLRHSEFNRVTPARLDEAIEYFCEQPPEQIVQETIEQIQGDANLLSCALRLLNEGQVAAGKLPIPTNETPNPLDLCGAFVRIKGDYVIKGDIWRHLLEKHLAPEQIGGWYAVAGYWQEAIEYLGKAVRGGVKAVRAELFAVIINAIHVSEESQEAYNYLGNGLHAAYPDSMIRLYRRGDQSLELMYHTADFEPDQDAIFLTESERPQIEALDGPDYSLASIEGETNLIIPLRAGHLRSRPIGLVELGGLFNIYSPYQQRKDVLRFVEFLRQASRALLRAELLKQDKQRRQLLDKVALITPKISQKLDLDEVYHAVLSQMLKYIPAAQYGCIAKVHPEQGIQIMSGFETYPVDGFASDGMYIREVGGRRGILTRAVRENKPFLVNDVSKDPDYIPAIPDTRSQLTVPIQIQQRVDRALILESNRLNAFTSDDQNLIMMVAEHARIAIENARQFRRASNRLLRERTAMMATGLIHDINSAVAGIPDLVEEVRYNLARSRDVSEPLNDLEKNALVTTRVSKRLRDFVVTGQHEVDFVELEALIRKAIEISEQSRPKNVTTVANMNGLNPQLNVDRLWIELLLKNLITNAYESFSPDEEGLVTLDVGIDPDNILVRVRDNGSGIESDVLEEIFSLGFTTKSRRQRMHGVGLFHCKMIAEVHDGDLLVESVPNEGTVFTVKLPRV